MTAATPAQPARTKPLPSFAPSSRRTKIAVAAGFAVAIALAAFWRPNLGLFFAASPVIQVHVYAALAALGLGAVLLTARKGRTFHRTMGWIWAGLMVVVAGVSLFITELTPGHWSLIHILSGWTLFAVPFALVMARRHKVRTHSRFMMGVYFGGLVITGALTFIPGRLMWMVFFEN